MTSLATMEDEEKRRRVIKLAFGECHEVFEDFCRAIQEAVPEAQAAVLRGSVITGVRWRDGTPFDADGPGTSDLDVTLVGDDVLRHFQAYWISGLHSKPLTGDDPDIAPTLVPLRDKLVGMVGRPVNIQGTRDWFQHFRGDVLGQPYLRLFGTLPESET